MALEGLGRVHHPFHGHAAHLFHGGAPELLAQAPPRILGHRPGVVLIAPLGVPARPHAGSATADDAVDQTLRARCRPEDAHALATGGLTRDRHPVRVAAEGRDVLTDPPQSGDLVEHAVVARGAGRRLLGQCGVRQETEYPEPVVDRDGDRLASGGQRLAVVQRKGAGAGGEPSAGYVDDHGEFRRGGLPAAPDVEVEAVLAHRIGVEERVLQGSFHTPRAAATSAHPHHGLRLSQETTEPATVRRAKDTHVHGDRPGPRRPRAESSRAARAVPVVHRSFRVPTTVSSFVPLPSVRPSGALVLPTPPGRRHGGEDTDAPARGRHRLLLAPQRPISRCGARRRGPVLRPS